MPLTINEYAAEMTEEVVRFNERLRANGVQAAAPTSPVSQWLPKTAAAQLFQEYYLASDENSVVRGAYTLKHQPFEIGDKAVPIAFYHEPLSEGIVEKAYGVVGLKLLLDALRRRPLLYCLGMGGFETPLPRMLAGLGWQLASVPFFFRVAKPSRFLRNIRYLRRSAPRRTACDVLAFSGLGWLLLKSVQAIRSRTVVDRERVDVAIVDDFGDWADELWNMHKNEYGMCAQRDCATLRLLYPSSNKRFLRIRLSEGDRTLGWAVCLNTQMSDDKYFGGMCIGSIADCFGSLADTGKVIAAAATILQERGADLIVSNQSHAAWGKALVDAGFFRGPSNEVFATSKKLTHLLNDSRVPGDGIHLNRGDGDGPIHL